MARNEAIDAARDHREREADANNEASAALEGPRGEPSPPSEQRTGTDAGPSPSSPSTENETTESGAAHSDYGQTGLPPGVVDLHRAFLKALPLAAKSIDTWKDLPLGHAGEVTIELEIGEDLTLAPIQIIEVPNSPAPQFLQDTALRNRAWLGQKRFALSPQKVAGKQRLVISAFISDKAPDKDTPRAKGTRAIGLLGGSSPTGAYFTYFSGRHVELKVLRVPAH